MENVSESMADLYDKIKGTKQSEESGLKGAVSASNCLQLC
jgi:hypothetical protein